MKLSIIIVNHNTSFNLSQTLTSLITGGVNIDHEIIVADNAWADGSLTMLQSNFQQVQVISGDSNSGISKATNQAIRATSGEYILLVSPGIISCRESLEKMVAFMDARENSGGLGVRMLTSQGRFLPESIYGLTKPWKVFFKLIGFNKYLSKTRLNNRNPKDWVEEFQIAEVDILNSDCMLLRRSSLNETGLFDERFSLYGHNIDLCYRLRLAGYTNYYFPKAYMIYTEASKISSFSWQYLKNFYGAMFKFAIKYLIRVPEIKVQGVSRLFPSSYEVK